jgi:hypothetical protein
MRGKRLFPGRTATPNLTFVGPVRRGKVTGNLEARGGIEPPIKVLQTFALPLGYRALGNSKYYRDSNLQANKFSLAEIKIARRESAAMGSKKAGLSAVTSRFLRTPNFAESGNRLENWR